MPEDGQLNVERLNCEPDERSEHDEWDQFDELDTPGDLDLSPDAWRLPPALRIMALLYILGGVMALVEAMLSRFVLHHNEDGAIIGFVLLVILGRGLFKWRSWASSWTAFLCTMVLLASVVASAISVYLLLSGRGPSSGGQAFGEPLGTFLSTIYCLIIAGLSAWVLHTLLRPDVAARFQMPRHVKDRIPGWQEYQAKHHAWRFSLRSLFVAMTFGAVVMLRLTADDVLYETYDRSATWVAGGTSLKAYFGFRQERFGIGREELEYVVLVTGDLRGRGVFRGPRRRVLSFGTADGKEFEVPGSEQLHEVVGEIHRSSEKRVTLAEVENFIESRLSECTIDALIKHAANMREK